jgi:hypothetical protein
MHHTPAHTVGCHGGTIHQDGLGASAKSRHVAPHVLLAYRASIHNSMGLNPASLMFRRELCLPCKLLFGAPPDKEQPTIDHTADLVDRLHNIQNYAHQHLKLAGDRMKTRYNRLANCVGYHEGDNVWLFRPTRTKGKSPKLQSPSEGPYRLVTWMNDVVYRIQQNPRSRMMAVHLDCLAPYQGTTQDERP